VREATAFLKRFRWVIGTLFLLGLAVVLISNLLVKFQVLTVALTHIGVALMTASMGKSGTHPYFLETG
jgi:uncharacterized membrane protein